MSDRKLKSVGPPQGSSGELLVAYCARPNCRARFERLVGPGRPKDYCSDDCRLAAHDEQRTLRSRLAHYEGVAEQIRTDIAAFGRSAGDGETGEPTERMLEHAAQAVARAEGLLRFAPESNPMTAEMKDLVQALSPLLRSAVSRAS